MRIKQIIFVLLISLLPAQVIKAQGRNYTKEADESFKYERYFAAIPLYTKAIGQVKNKIEKKRIMFQLAECYRLTKDNKKAEQQYLRAIKAGYSDAIVYLRYAETLKELGKYKDAEEQFKEYVKLVPGDPRGKNGLKAIALYDENIKNPTRYQVSNVIKLNTKDDEFSPVYADKKFSSVVFTSNRKESGDEIDPNTGLPYTQLFIATLDKRNNWSRPILVDEQGGVLNDDCNNGSSSFNKKYTTIYFTRCNVEKDMILGCDVYTSALKGNLWESPTPLNLVPDSLSAGHPAISDSEKDIYIASDIPGGFGGKDIYIAKRRKKNGEFAKPVNLGSVINTRGNEMFPTLREMEDGRLFLYFASDGHIGLGGLDLYRTEYVDGKWTEPVNLGYPINSSADDFGIVFDGRTVDQLVKKTINKPDVKCDEMGYFSSNRIEMGSKGGYDIYEFWLPEVVFSLEGVIRDNLTLQLLKGAKVVMQGSDGSNVVATTDAKGYYKFNKNQVLKNTTYTLEVSYPKYFKGTGETTTVGLKESKDLTLNINLTPIPKDPIPLPEIRYDVAKWDLKPQYQDSLNGLLATMKKENTIVIELVSHTDFRDETVKNDTLSYKRSKSVVDYLVTKGIDGDRMIPIGKGERDPRYLAKGYTFSAGEYKGVSFQPGTVLSEEFINKLPSKKEQEAAHQLNRRTEFRIIRDDYVPKNSNDTVKVGAPVISVNPDDKKLPFELKKDTIFAQCYLNGNTYTFAFIEKEEDLIISGKTAYALLAQHKITKNDFEQLDSAFTADGSIKDGSRLNIKSLLIGTKRIYDINAKVSLKIGPAIILGDIILSDFYDYKVDKEQKKFIFE